MKNALIIAPRFPWPPYTGDRLRATIWLSALARNAQVSLVAPNGAPASAGSIRPAEAGAPYPAEAGAPLPPFRFFPAQRSLVHALHGVASLIRERLPFQCLLTAPYDWSAAIARAKREAGPFDVTIVVLARLHPWIRKSLDGRSVLDAVDSLSRNAAERTKAAPFITRWLWRAEEHRMTRVEHDAAKTYGKIVVVSDDEARDLGEAITITTGITTAPLNGSARAHDFGFWGRLPYFANADAVHFILDEIWPRIRALKPGATMIIGGAGASRSLRNAAQQSGVTLLSPVDDMTAFARNIRVALMPVRYGSGQATKVLEAAEAGCAIVGTPQAFRGLAPLAAHARIEHDAQSLARAAVDLLDDDAARRSMAARLRETIETQYARAETLDRFSAIAGMAETT